MTTKLEDQVRAPALASSLLPGEQIVRAVHAFVPWDHRTPLRMLGAVGTAIQRAERAQRNPLPFALPAHVAIAVTDARILFWSYEGILWRRPRVLLGGLDFADVEKVEVSGRRRVLGFWLVARTLELAINDLDDARVFAAAVTDALPRAARA